MNKKIKIIELLNKIANGEEVPKKIKFRNKVYTYKDIPEGTGYVAEGYDWFNSDVYIDSIDDLNSYVEILEDNTEEIEELKFGLQADNFTAYQLQYFFNMNRKVDEIREAVNELRKENKK